MKLTYLRKEERSITALQTRRRLHPDLEQDIQVLILPEQNRPGLLSDTSVPRIEFHSLSTRHEFRVDDRVYPVKRFADICSWKSGTPTGDVRPSNARRRVGNDAIWNASNRILCVRSNKI